MRNAILLLFIKKIIKKIQQYSRCTLGVASKQQRHELLNQST